MLEIKERYTLEEVEKANGCIMVWKSKNNQVEFVRGNAWQELARALMNKNFHKMPHIKRINHGTYYMGIRWVRIHEENGTRYFEYGGN